MQLRSIRVRLAAWHTLAVGVLLAVFSGGTWLFLTHTARVRADQALAELTQNYVGAWANERHEAGDGLGAAIAAAQEAARDFRYEERRVYVIDDADRIVAASDTAPLAPRLALGRLAARQGGPAAALLAAARSGRGSSVTLDADAPRVRASATRVMIDTAPFTVLALRSMRAEDAAADAFTEVLVVAVPLVLLLAAAGGYWLTRASLAPVVAMGATAARIGSGTLNDRLPIVSPHDELGALATVFNALLARVETAFVRQTRAIDEQRQFMADASHELRTPVTALITVADVALARDDRRRAELREALDVVRDEGRRLGRIVEDLFLLARADAGQFPVRREPLYLEEVVQASARAVRAVALARGVTLQAPLADEAPFRGDPHLLRRLLMNLLDNAVKYTPAGGRVCVSLVATPAACDASAVPGGSAYVIAVEDTGCGIALEARSRLFERFYRADPARTREVVEGVADPGPTEASGAGLGLAIARWIAEAHGATVRLASSGADGSRFEVVLPVDAPRPTGTR